MIARSRCAIASAPGASRSVHVPNTEFYVTTPQHSYQQARRLLSDTQLSVLMASNVSPARLLKRFEFKQPQFLDVNKIATTTATTTAFTTTNICNAPPKESNTTTLRPGKAKKKVQKEPVHFIDNTKKAKRLKQVAERTKGKGRLKGLQARPSVISPEKGVLALQRAHLKHPLSFHTNSTLSQQFRGYLCSNPSTSLWKETMTAPEEMTKDDVWKLHDLSQTLEIENEVFYISSDSDLNNTAVPSVDEGDSSILELAVFAAQRAPTHVSDSEFNNDDILVTETKVLGNPVEISDGIFSDIDDEGFVSDKETAVPESVADSIESIAETPIPENDSLPPTPGEVRQLEHVDYTRMKMAELRAVARSKGLKCGRTKQSIIDLLLQYDHKLHTAPNLELRDREQELTDTLKSTALGLPWWEAMLCYEPLNIDDFYTFVRTTLMLNLTLVELKQYCDSRGICFQSYDLKNG